MCIDHWEMLRHFFFQNLVMAKSCQLLSGVMQVLTYKILTLQNYHSFSLCASRSYGGDALLFFKSFEIHLSQHLRNEIL